MGKPQAVVTEEDLALKEANKVSEGRGEPVLARGDRGHDMKMRKSRRSPSLTATSRRISRANGDNAQLTRSNRTSDRQMVKPIAERGMVLPFEPLSISFDDICYFVDLPAVSQSINPFTCCNHRQQLTKKERKFNGLHLIDILDSRRPMVIISNVHHRMSFSN